MSTVKVTVGGKEVEYADLESMARDFQQVAGQHQQLMGQADAIRKNEALLTAIRQDPQAAIERIAIANGLPNPYSPMNGSSGFDEDPLDGFAPQAGQQDSSITQLQQMMQALMDRVEQVDLRAQINGQVGDVATKTGLQTDDLKQFMLTNRLADAGQAARLMQAEKILADQQAASAATAAEQAQKAALEASRDQAAALMGGGGLNALSAPPSGYTSTSDAIRAAMAEQGL